MAGIGPRLREERMRLKLSQSALGAMGGVETNAQGNYESGARSPKADYLQRINSAGVDIHYVLTGMHANPSAECSCPASLNGADTDKRLGSVTHELHQLLHGLIDALYNMALLIEVRLSDTRDDAAKTELQTIKADAQELAQASVRLIFVTSKLT